MTELEQEHLAFIWISGPLLEGNIEPAQQNQIGQRRLILPGKECYGHIAGSAIPEMSQLPAGLMESFRNRRGHNAMVSDFASTTIAWGIDEGDELPKLPLVVIKCLRVFGRPEQQISTSALAYVWRHTDDRKEIVKPLRCGGMA